MRKITRGSGAEELSAWQATRPAQPCRQPAELQVPVPKFRAAGPRSPAATGGQVSQQPLLGPAPAWAAMQKPGLPQGRPLHHGAHSPGTSAGAGRRTSAKRPPSPHPISRPPPAAENALPNREPGPPPNPRQATAGTHRCRANLRLKTANPTQTWPPGQAAGTSAPMHPPLRQPGKTLHPSDGLIAGIRHSGKEK